MLFIKIILLE